MGSGRAAVWVLGALALVVGLSPARGRTDAPWEVVPDPAPMPAADANGLVHVNGQDIYYEIHGTTGPWIVFLHGGLGSALAWGNQVPAFAAHNRVLLIESRGHGRSSWDGAPITYEAMASDVLGVMDTLGIAQADIVGWSDGGIIGLILGLEHPERILKIVADGANSDPDGLLDDVLGDPAGREEGEDVSASMTETEPEQALAEAVNRMWANEPHITDRLGEIRVPVLVMAGDHDLIKPDHTRMIADSIPDSTLEIVPDAAHFVIWQQPDLFNRDVKAFLGVE